MWCSTPSEYPKSIELSESGMLPTVARWNSQLVWSARFLLATASASALASTQCNVPTRGATNRAHSPLPHPASN